MLYALGWVNDITLSNKVREQLLILNNLVFDVADDKEKSGAFRKIKKVCI